MPKSTDVFITLRQELVSVLVPFMTTESDRRAILDMALLSAAHQRVDFHGAAGVFTVNMVNTLLRYGQDEQGNETIISVLNVLYGQVGVNNQRVIDQLRQQVQAHLQNLSQAERNALFPGPRRASFFDLGGLAIAVEKWLGAIISPTDMPDHLATSWVGRFIYIVRKLTDGIRPEQLWTLLVWLTLWVATNWLVAPILRWPLDNVTERARAALLYALATLVIPFFVALVSPVDRQSEMRLENRRDWARFWFLKLIGAATGFALAAGIIGVAMVAYYLGGSLPRAVQWALTLVPLLFSHVGARRIPGDRLKLYGEVRPHEVDKLVVVVWLLLGPGTAAAVYWGYAAIANPAMGLLVLIGFCALLFWELQKQKGDKETGDGNGLAPPAPRRLPDTARIAIFGLLLPLVFLGLIFGLSLFSSLPSAGEWWALAVVTPYFVGLSLLVATIFVRNPPILTIRGMVGVLLALWSIAYLSYLDLRAGGAFALVLILAWLVWGRRRWRRYLWVHPSFGVVCVVIGMTIYLWTQAIVPPWTILLGWMAVSAGLIGWAFRPQ